MIASIGGAIITVGTILAWYNRRIEARVVIQRRITHLENDQLGHSKNIDFLHGQQEKEIAVLESKIDELEHKSTNLYWMLKTVMAKVEIDPRSIGLDGPSQAAK